MIGGSLALLTSTAAQSGNGANGQNLTVFVGNDLVAHNAANSGGVDLEIITPTQQTANSGANLFLGVGHNLTTDSGGDTTLFVNNNMNRIANGGRILGTIGGNLQTNNLTIQLLNNAGEIDTGGNVSLEVSGNLTAQGDAIFEIQNNGGTMGQNAPMRVAASNISANSLLAQIDNRNDGVIDGAAVISMSIGHNATVTNNATLAIYGSDGAAASAILVNGGNYNIGDTFLSYIDGNGSITFSNASAHADVLKAGVFGTNGTLNIGGGTLSADTTLKLYAPGSNGQLNFFSNVTLDGNSKKILAANSVTIFDNVVVTIGGKAPADVYTNNPNYTGFGGNGSTTGTFAGAGANRPRPLSDAPPFDPQAAPGNPTNGKRTRTVINVKNSGQLLSLLDDAVPGPGGKLRVPHHNHRNSNRADRLNVARMTKVDRDVADIRRMRDRGVINNRLGSGTRAF